MADPSAILSLAMARHRKKKVPRRRERFRDVLCQLVGPNGEPLMSMDILICTKNVRVSDVRDALHYKLRDSVLEGFTPSNLSVYANHVAFKAENHQPVDIADPLGDFGVDEELVVVAPAAFKRRRIMLVPTHTDDPKSPYFVQDDTADSELALNHSINYSRTSNSNFCRRTCFFWIEAMSAGLLVPGSRQIVCHICVCINHGLEHVDSDLDPCEPYFPLDMRASW